MKMTSLIGGAVALGLLTGSALAGPGHGPGQGHSHAEESVYGKPGDPKKPSRIVQVVFREDDGKMLFLPNNLKVRKGEQILF